MSGDPAQSILDFLKTFFIDLGDLTVMTIRFVLYFIVAWLIARMARKYLEPALSRRTFGRDGAILIGRLVSIVAYLFAAIACMNYLGANWTGILALLSAFTVAIGLSLQDVMKNFFSGIMMLLERPFSVGDRVRVRDFEGEIQGIDVRTTLIRNDDGALVMVPNSVMFGEVLVNRSYFRSARVRIIITVSSRSIEQLDADVANALNPIELVKRPIPHGEILLRSGETLRARYQIPVASEPGAEDRVVAPLLRELKNAEIEVERA